MEDIKDVVQKVALQVYGSEATAQELEFAARLMAELQNDAEPVAWANADELDNMLDDRTAAVAGVRDGWRKTPLYTHSQPKAATVPTIWNVRLASPTDADPFRKLDCKVVDVGYSERVLIVEVDDDEATPSTPAQKVATVPQGSIQDFADELKVLCNDYASRNQTVYVSDFRSLIQALADRYKSAAPSLPAKSAASKKSHRWDDVGERCLDCGDKDWMADPYCSAQSEGEQKCPLCNGVGEVGIPGATCSLCKGKGTDPLQPSLPAAEEDARDAVMYRWWKKNRPIALLTSFYGNGCINKTVEGMESDIAAMSQDSKGEGE